MFRKLKHSLFRILPHILILNATNFNKTAIFLLNIIGRIGENPMIEWT